MSTKIKWKIQACFILYFNFEVLLLKVIRNSYRFSYFLFYSIFNISRYHFSQIFRTSFNIQFSFFNWFTQFHIPAPLNGQNMVSVTKGFCQFSLRSPLKYFFSKFCWQNPAKASFIYQQWTATAIAFLKVLTINSLTFFSEQIFQEQASVIQWLLVNIIFRVFLVLVLFAQPFQFHFSNINLKNNSHPYSLHSHPDSPHSYHFHPDSQHSHHSHSDSQHSHHSHPDSQHSHHSRHSVP